MTLFKDRPLFENMVITGMRQTFSWDAALDRYFSNFRTAALYQWVAGLQRGVDGGQVELTEAVRATHTLLALQTPDIQADFWRLLERKRPDLRTPIYNLLLATR